MWNFKAQNIFQKKKKIVGSNFNEDQFIKNKCSYFHSSAAGACTELLCDGSISYVIIENVQIEDDES